MHRRVWRWRRLAHCCDQCGLRWGRKLTRCLDDQRTADPVEAPSSQPYDWTGPTLMLQPFRLTVGQRWRAAHTPVRQVNRR